jgi:iron complex outermembrane receptor protein
VSVKFRPFEPIMFRGGYNTGFRVPSFNQIFNGRTESPYAGRDLVDPVRCPSGVPNATDPNCAIIQPTIITGGNPNLGPETSEQATLGVVLTPSRRFSASVDWWMINVDNSIGILSERQLLENASLFSERFIRDASGTIVEIDRSNINTGARRTQGLEVVLRGGFDVMGGALTAGLDGTYLIKKREKLIPSAPFGPSQIGVFSFSGDLGLRWKHNAFITYAQDEWTFSFSQIYRSGYRNQQLPGIANGTVTRPNVVERVNDYMIYNTSLSFTGIEGMTFTLGVRNLFDTDPPFAITYDSNTGAGSSWEPRVADPRGRSFTVGAEFKF